MTRRLGWAVAAIAVAAALAGPVASAGATTLLRLNGIGPLKIGMTRAAALQTGWLAERHSGCPLGGPPVPITYRLTGPKAPKGLDGSVEFTKERLRVLSFSHGVRTATGVHIGTSILDMVGRYHRAGLTAKSMFSDVFGGTFVSVSAGRRQVIEGFGEHKRVTALAIPAIPLCD